jgi:hypothetical protein
MTEPNCRVRRATIDDLIELRRLWEQAQLPVLDLEKRVTEFQVAEVDFDNVTDLPIAEDPDQPPDPSGRILGAIGLQIQGQHGRLHSEAYALGQADVIRPLLWERTQTIARNHGLIRIWINGSSDHFWIDKGFKTADADALKGLPEKLAFAGDLSWLTLGLRTATSVSLEQELAILRQAQQAESAKRGRQAQMLRALAAVVVLVVLLLMAFAAWYILRGLKGRV